ncbi:hypothetical protein D3C85_1534830 [compost metagenome]
MPSPMLKVWSAIGFNIAGAKEKFSARRNKVARYILHYLSLVMVRIGQSIGYVGIKASPLMMGKASVAVSRVVFARPMIFLLTGALRVEVARISLIEDEHDKASAVERFMELMNTIGSVSSAKSSSDEDKHSSGPWG